MTTEHERKNNKIVLVACGVVFVLSFGLFLSDWFVFDVVDGINKATLNHSVVDNARHIVLKFADNANPLMLFKPQNSFIEEYDFVLSTNDLNYFNYASKESVEAGYIVDRASNFRSVVLNGVFVKMALFGDRPENFIFTKKAFKIKTNKDRFNFVLPENRGFTVSIFQAEVAKEIGLIPFKYGFGSVKINGDEKGLYFIEESVKEYAKRQKVVLLQHSDNWIEDHPIQQSDSLHWKLAGLIPPGGYDYSAGVTFGMGHNTPFDLDISNFETEDTKLNYRLYQLLKATETNDQNVFEELFDIENISSIEALRALFGNVHNFTGDNLRLFYNEDTNKFGFVPRFEGTIELVEISNAGIDNYLTTFAGLPVPILRYVAGNDVQRNLRNEKLYQLLQDKQKIMQLYDKVDEKYRVSLVSDLTINSSSREIAHFINVRRRLLEENFSVLSKQFYYSKVYVNIIQEGNRVFVEVIPDSATAIEFDSFLLRINDGNVFEAMELKYLINANTIQAGLGNKMEPVRTVFDYEVLLPGSDFRIGSANVVVRNAITGRRILEEDVYVKIAKD